MILNQNQQSDAQLIGDIQNNKVGIDTNNLDFITSLLTTNLYSQPIQSFIRETVANGWDSHVEAGTTDKPVILRIYSDCENNIHLAVRDYGTGLSPERFNEIYLNIGSSTKRASNQYIGAFGLGRFSSLAVSNIVHLTNYYNGTVSNYIMYKDNAKICIDKIFESSTKEENGLEVDVNTEAYVGSYSTCTKIREGIEFLTFYNNIYIDDPEDILHSIGDASIRDFNNRKIADFKTFKICNCLDVNNALLMGNVLYPINTDIIESWFKGKRNIPIAIKCNIGDVDVTPNREQLLYNQKTIDTINNKCKDALEEIRSIAKTIYNSDLKSIQEYYDLVGHDDLPIKIKEFENRIVYIKVPGTLGYYYSINDNLTINGKKPSKTLIDRYINFLYFSIPECAILYYHSNEKFYRKDKSLSIRDFIKKSKDSIYITNEPLKPISKKYFNANTSDYKTTYFIYKPYIHIAFIKFVKRLCKNSNIKPTDPDLKFIYQDFITNYTNLNTFNNTDIPQDFIDEVKKEEKSKRIATQQKARKCVIYTPIKGRSYGSVSYDTSYTLDTLKCYKGTIFFAEKGNPYLEQFWIMLTAMSVNYTLIVEVAPSNLPILRELKNAIEFNTVFVKKNNIVSKICTYVYLVEKYNIEHNSSYWCDELVGNKDFKRIINTIVYCKRNLLEYNNKCEELLKYLCKIYLDKNWLNYNIINKVEAFAPYIRLINIFNARNFSYIETLMVAFYDYVTKNKISVSRFIEIKEILKPILNEYTPNQKLPHFDVG